MESDLESNGWRQGSLAKARDIPYLLEGIVDTIHKDAELVIVSQSCDLAQSQSVEPVVEAILAECVDRPDGNYTYNKNGRTLDIAAKVKTDNDAIVDDKHIRLQAVRKLSIPKDRFAGLEPTNDRALPLELVSVLADWLGARYSRPALPTAFNDAVAGCDPSLRKLRKIAKRMSKHTAGLYVALNPERDLLPHEKYRVNILALIIPSAKSHRSDVQHDVDAVKELLESAGMDVTAVVSAEDEVSVAVVKRMRRLQLNDLSHRSGDPLPPG